MQIVLDKFEHPDTTAYTSTILKTKYGVLDLVYFRDIRFKFEQIERCAIDPKDQSVYDRQW